MLTRLARTPFMQSENGTFPATTTDDFTSLMVSDAVSMTSLDGLVRDARTFAASAKARATRKAYGKDWSMFTAWCTDAGLTSLPASPATVATYATHMVSEGLAVATIQRAMVSLSQAHKLAGHASPTSSAIVLETLKGIRRQLGTMQVKKNPVLPDQIRSMVSALPDNLLGVRDRVILLLGFSGGFRRSELVGLDVRDIEFTDDGMVVTLKRSKTDQDGQGRRVGVPFGSTPTTCPVRCTKAWLEAACIREGAVFRPVGRWGRVGQQRLDDRAVARVVQRGARAIGLDAAKFAGHSLRAGLATAAARAGKTERSIMNQTGHRSVQMVRRYIREGSLFVENAAAGLL